MASGQKPGESKQSGGSDRFQYPEQRHAGHVGLGPEYKKADTGDKITGYLEEFEGKILRKPEKAEHGHLKHTGELKKKELEEQDKQNPFATAEEGGGG